MGSSTAVSIGIVVMVALTIVILLTDHPSPLLPWLP